VWMTVGAPSPSSVTRPPVGSLSFSHSTNGVGCRCRGSSGAATATGATLADAALAICPSETSGVAARRGTLGEATACDVQPRAATQKARAPVPAQREKGVLMVSALIVPGVGAAGQVAGACIPSSCLPRLTSSFPSLPWSARAPSSWKAREATRVAESAWGVKATRSPAEEAEEAGERSLRSRTRASSGARSGSAARRRPPPRVANQAGRLGSNRPSEAPRRRARTRPFGALWQRRDPSRDRRSRGTAQTPSSSLEETTRFLRRGKQRRARGERDPWQESSSARAYQRSASTAVTVSSSVLPGAKPNPRRARPSSTIQT
jgi:hypothetical protein